MKIKNILSVIGAVLFTTFISFVIWGFNVHYTVKSNVESIDRIDTCKLNKVNYRYEKKELKEAIENVNSGLASFKEEQDVKNQEILRQLEILIYLNKDVKRSLRTVYNTNDSTAKDIASLNK